MIKKLSLMAMSKVIKKAETDTEIKVETVKVINMQDRPLHEKLATFIALIK
jgi:hypothetical protein